MGSNARGKHKRENRSSRHVESNDHNDRDAKFGSNEQVGSEEVVDIQNSTDDNDWCLYCFVRWAIRHLLRKARLSNGHCYGKKNVLSNILDNTVRFLDTGKRDGDRRVFDNMTQLIDLPLAALIVMLQKSKPHMSKGDAMLYLLLNDLNLDP
ncbi:hypothetical protein ACET3Z_005573 [Daucus carota]